MRCRGNKISMWHWVLMNTRCNESSDVSHINEKIRSYFFGDFTHSLKIDFTRVSRRFSLVS